MCCHVDATRPWRIDFFSAIWRGGPLLPGMDWLHSCTVLYGNCRTSTYDDVGVAPMLLRFPADLGPSPDTGSERNFT
jgi:hypothetical protein